MSYTIAKSITVKNGRVTITGRCNNVWPSTYTTYETIIDTDELLRLLDDGVIQPIASANGYKWTWITQHGLKGLTGKQRSETFARLAEERPKGKYVLRTKDGRYLANIGHGYGLCSERDAATKMGKYQAAHVAAMYSRHEPQAETA